MADRLGSAEKAARSWLSSIEAMERHAARLFIIRYEDLIREPDVVLKSLGDRLGVRPDLFRSRMVRPTSQGRYIQGLSVEELDQIMEIALPTMRRLGYEV
jgi:hypothetical protein